MTDDEWGKYADQTLKAELARDGYEELMCQLEALKRLLPEFEGEVNCIYIDPLHNTDNEGWGYHWL